MSLPFENELQRELARVRRQREGGQHTDLAARMDTPTLSPAGVGSSTAPPPPPSMDISSMTDMVAELSRPVDRAQLDQEIDDFNLTYPVNVDDALNAFTLPPVAGTSTAPATTTAPLPPSITTAPTTTATQTRPTTSTRTRPTTTTTTSRPRPVTSTRTRPATTATTTTAPSRPLTARRSAGAGTRTTTSTVTTPTGRPTIAAKQPRRRPRVPSSPSPDSPPPSDDEDDDDDDDDRRRGLRRRLDLLNEDAQQRARGRRIRNITHTNTVTTVYEDGGGRPSVRPPERPAQVHQDHHAEDGAVAVAEHADGVDASEKDIKTVGSLPPS